MKNDVKRIEWCDIYKGIVILLMVIGHYSSDYQNYIYSFHMPAFFFISGYTCNFKRDTTLDFIVKKFISLMMPYLFFGIIGTSIFWLFNKLDILSYVSTTIFPERYQDAFLAIFNNGAVWCDWLGALWFVPVLFAASILSKILLNSFSSVGVLVVSILIFMIGQGMSVQGGSPYPTDLIMIAQYFVVLGALVKENGCLQPKRLNGIRKYIVNILYIIIVVSAFVLYLSFGIMWTTDWPIRNFNGFIDLITPLLGVFICTIFSKLLEKVKYVKEVFIFMGKNTFAIMVFHFLGFKLFYALLALLGKESYEIIAVLTPTDSIRHSVWFGVPVVISICASIFVWSLLMKSRIVRICCGKERCVENYILSDPVYVSFQEAYIQVTVLMRGMLDALKSRRKNFAVYALLVIAIYLLTCLFSILSYAGSFEITFPSEDKHISFNEGWYGQTESESYRWVGKESKATVFLVNQKEMNITGYIPSNVSNMNEIQVFVNNEMVYKEDVTSDYLFDITLDISRQKKIGKNEICFKFDGCRIPSKDDLDERKFSALIEEISFE